MFNTDISDEEDIAASQITQKKRKLNTCDTDVVHSSLGYETFKAPPIVEYKSIDSYCENKLGKSLLPCDSDDSQTGSYSKISSISSPIVLKSPNQCAAQSTVGNRGYVPPYFFFSVEELSLVRSLSHWSNTKVCPVGRVDLDTSTQEFYLYSVLEKGSWQVLLDMSTVKEIPKIKTVIQIFGYVEVIAEKPVIKIHFYRYLGSTDLTLFVKSYRMMQKYIPDFLNRPKEDIIDTPVIHSVEDLGLGCELNNTLDDYNLSAIEKLEFSKDGNEQAITKTN